MSGSAGRAAAGRSAPGSAAQSSQATRPNAADVDRGKGTVESSERVSINDASIGRAPEAPERPLGVETVRDDLAGGGSTGQRMTSQRNVGTAGGSAVTGRGAQGQGGRGLSPWFAGAENPFAMMRRMEEDLDRVFRAFGIPRLAPSIAPPRELEELLARSPGLRQAAEWSPQIEVLDQGDNLIVRADLPGVKRDDVEVNVENDVLTIRGERRQEQREAQGGYRRTERSYGTFFRQIPLPDGVDPSQIAASYADGVLEVTIPSPRDQRQGRRRVEIR